jgi:hypothetical protein
MYTSHNKKNSSDFTNKKNKHTRIHTHIYIPHTRNYFYSVATFTINSFSKSNIQGYIYTKSQRPYIINDSSKVLDLATFYDRHTRGGGGQSCMFRPYIIDILGH